jgi:hypothetical protein
VIRPALPPLSRIVVLDSDGRSRLVYLDITGRNVFTLDPSGAEVARWTTSPGKVDSRPLGAADIAVAPSGEVAVSREAYGQVERYSAEGVLLETRRDAELEFPAGVDYASDGALIVRSSTSDLPWSRLLRVLPGASPSLISYVPPGGMVSGAGASTWLTTMSTVVGLRDGAPHAILGGDQFRGPVDQGDLDSIGLNDVAALPAGSWVSDGLTIQHFSNAGRLRLACRPSWPDEMPGRLTAIGQTLYVSTGLAIHPVRPVTRRTRDCETPRLRLSELRLATTPRRGERRLRVRYRLSHSARLDATLLVDDQLGCPTGWCGVGDLARKRARRGRGHVAYRVPAGALDPGTYLVRIAARSRALSARGDGPLLRFRVG